MIKTSSKQKGSAHVVIIVVLVLAVVGVLGFVFWQNFIHKESAVTNTETPVAEKGNSAKDMEERLVNVHISDLGLMAMVPASLGDLTSEPIHLEGDQAVNSVVLSSEKAELSGCERNSGPLGYLTYDTDKEGGTLVAIARGGELYYLPPDNTCEVITSKNISDLRAALKSLVSDNSNEKTAR